MNILYKRIKNIYLGLFFLSPKLLSTIIFIPFLYIFGWIFATPIFLLGVDKENLSLIGTILLSSYMFFLYQNGSNCAGVLKILGHYFELIKLIKI